MSSSCALVIPCRDEGPALLDVLRRVPDRMSVIVVDNGSRDDTAAVALGWGAVVVTEPQPGYGAAVQAGVAAATSALVAVIDGDGTLDPTDLVPLVDAVASGSCDLAVGRRMPAHRGLIPWPARAGNLAATWWLRRQGLQVHDIAPVRVCRRLDLLALSVEDRRYGYPFELLGKAARAGWRVEEFPVGYGERATGTRSKVSGSLRGTAYATLDAVRALS
jgi:glycosyltransferase involved in cell wall biosynthesis